MLVRKIHWSKGLQRIFLPTHGEFHQFLLSITMSVERMRFQLFHRNVKLSTSISSPSEAIRWHTKNFSFSDTTSSVDVSFREKSGKQGPMWKKCLLCVKRSSNNKRLAKFDRELLRFPILSLLNRPFYLALAVIRKHRWWKPVTWRTSPAGAASISLQITPLESCIYVCSRLILFYHHSPSSCPAKWNP